MRGPAVIAFGADASTAWSPHPAPQPVEGRASFDALCRHLLPKGEGRAAHSPLPRGPGRVVAQREREKAGCVAGRIDDGPGPLAGDVLVLAGSAQERDVAAFRAFIGHEQLVAV